jgi:hypothetical protein
LNHSKRNSFFADKLKPQNMKRITLIIFTAFGFLATAQTDGNLLTQSEATIGAVEVDTIKHWKWSGLYSAAMTQTSLTNWAAGGNNNVNVSGLVKQLGVYSKNKWVWNNLLEANFGYNFQSGGDLKTDDRLEFTTRLDRELGSQDWRLSLFANLRTQFAEGFKNQGDANYISKFMAPGYLTYGIGITNASFKGLNVYFSPVQVKQTFVLDSTLAADGVFYTIDAPNVAILNGGGTYRTELGAYLDIIYKKAFSDQFEVSSKLNLFSNYLDRPQNIDVNWEAIFLMKVYKYLSVSLQVQLIYDNDVLVQDTSGDGISNAPGTQFKQILGVGLAYSFGAFKK